MGCSKVLQWSAAAVKKSMPWTASVLSLNGYGSVLRFALIFYVVALCFLQLGINLALLKLLHIGRLLRSFASLNSSHVQEAQISRTTHMRFRTFCHSILFKHPCCFRKKSQEYEYDQTGMDAKVVSDSLVGRQSLGAPAQTYNNNNNNNGGIRFGWANNQVGSASVPIGFLFCLRWVLVVQLYLARFNSCRLTIRWSCRI